VRGRRFRASPHPTRSILVAPLARNGDTEGTKYLTASASHTGGSKLTLAASVGYTWVANYDDLNYLDYRFGVTYAVGGWSLGAALVGSDADEKYWYAGPNGDGDVKQIGEASLVLSLGKVF